MRAKKALTVIVCLLTAAYFIISRDVSDIPYNPVPENILWESVYAPPITSEHYSTLCFGTITVYYQSGKWRDGCNVYTESFETPAPDKQWIFILLIIYKMALVLLWIIFAIYAAVTVSKTVRGLMRCEMVQRKKLVTPTFGRVTVWTACLIVGALFVFGYWTVPFLIGVPDYIWMFLKGEHYLMLKDMHQAEEIFSRLAMVHVVLGIAGKIAISAGVCFGIYKIIQKIIRLVPSYKTHMPQYRNLRNMMTVASFAGVLIGLVVVEFSIRNTGKYMTGSEIRGNGFISPWSPDLAEWSSPRIPGEYSAQQTEYFSYPPKKVNNAGFLDIPWKEKKDSTKRIMCLGDSYMEGFGASLDSSCPRILQALLPHTEVLNAGLTGRDIFSEYMLLKEYLLDVYHPDAVIVEIAILGLRSSAITSGGLERFNAAGQVISKKAPWYEPLYKNFHLVRFMALRWFSCDPETHLPMGVLPDEQQKAIEKMKVCMDEYVRLCEERNVFCLFCFRPSNSDFKTESIELQRLKLYAKQEHYPYIDLLRYFKEKGVPDVMSEYYWVQEGHHTPKGYACMADGIASYFINRPDENYFQAEN